ncbi:hypothetical protein OAP94_01000 [bacterium]|nr:hypothetical protein [bacterium]MDC1007242.1 hypothetical protein [bacterium]
MKQSELLEKSKGLYHNVNKRKKAGTSRSKDHPDAPSPQDWKNAAKTAKETTNEGLAELAGAAERDHEVQMARAELYKIAKYAIKLHEILKGVSEAEGIEGWIQSKITKSADYMGSVYHAMDYDNKFEGVEVTESQKDTHCSDKCCGADVKREDCTCPPTCKHCNCNDPKVAEGKSPHAKGTKKYKKHMAAMHAEGTYKNHLQAKLNEASACADDCDCDDCNCCTECGNPSWKNVSEDKKKGSHGKVCWKGYRRGEGNSCHKVKGDG